MKNNTKKTTIGGQAVIEGVMMRGPELSALAVRSSDGEIKLEQWETYPNGKPKGIKKMPFFRGVFNMIDTMLQGFKCLMTSADLSGMEEEEPSKFELWLAKVFKSNVNDVVATFAIVFAVLISVLMLVVIPTGVTSLLKSFIDSSILIATVEGVIKILIFVLYLFFCSKNPDVARVFQYHGAEHKTIACYEAGEELTPENCKKYTRLHPRCGTSFLLIVCITSIIIFALIPSTNVLLRMVLKLLVLPVVVGISYEVIKLTGRHDNSFTRLLSAPGLALQKLTTSEPDLEQLEVAIASMKIVIPEDEENDKW